MQCGKQAINVLQRLEERTKVTGYMFKPLEAIIVPEDWSRWAATLEMGEHKATAKRLRDVATEIIRDRWWTWVLLHPELDATHIHPTRSMPPSHDAHVLLHGKT